MVAKLYSADLFDNATPVSAAPSEPVAKKPRTEKQIAALEKAKATRLAKKAEKEGLENKSKMEAEANQKAKDEVNEKEKQKEEAKLAKMVERREKRRLARLEKKTCEASPSESNGDEKPVPLLMASDPLPKAKRQRKTKKVVDSNETPAWFQQYLVGVKTEQSKLSNDHKSKKVIKAEAETEANAHWQEPLVRDRVNHEANNHLSRMHSMIFGGR